MFWAGCGTLCFVYGFFRIPETGGFSFAELDILFAAKVPARKFKKVDIKGGSLSDFLRCSALPLTTRR